MFWLLGEKEYPLGAKIVRKFEKELKKSGIYR